MKLQKRREREEMAAASRRLIEAHEKQFRDWYAAHVEPAKRRWEERIWGRRALDGEKRHD